MRQGAPVFSLSLVPVPPPSRLCPIFTIFALLNFLPLARFNYLLRFPPCFCSSKISRPTMDTFSVGGPVRRTPRRNLLPASAILEFEFRMGRIRVFYELFLTFLTLDKYRKVTPIRGVNKTQKCRQKRRGFASLRRCQIRCIIKARKFAFFTTTQGAIKYRLVK